MQNAKILQIILKTSLNLFRRQMFPGVKLHFENLNPYKFYKVYMEFAPVDGMRYRFDRNSWAPRGTIETSITSSLIEHSQSPAEGFKWMYKPVDFHVRLTNCLENNNDETVSNQYSQIVDYSFHLSGNPVCRF